MSTNPGIDNELLAALVDALEYLDKYLMANWDEHARRRVRQRFALVQELLREEQKARKREASAS